MLLLGFCLALAAPAFTLSAAQSAKMSCCKRGSGPCCKKHQKQQTEPAWTAGNECAKPCALSILSPKVSDSLAASSASHVTESAFSLAASIPEEIRSRSTSYLAFLYQLPPPTLFR